VPNDFPFCLCIAGPNGSGKSTLARGLRRQTLIENWIDPDVVAEEIKPTDERADERTISREAFIHARHARLEYATKLSDFGFERVFSHGSNLGFIKALRHIGYVVHLYFVCTNNPDINVTRVKNRTILGGHAVPEDKIRNRYLRSLRLLAFSLRGFDRIVLLDNSDVHMTGSPNGIVEGRVVGEIIESRLISFHPTVPDWAFKYAVFPYSTAWMKSEMRRTASDLFEEQARCEAAPGDLTSDYEREEFLSQFRIT
jgi:predicted ABC-type ATPase